MKESKSTEEAAIKAQTLKTLYQKTENFELTGDAETDANIRGQLINDEEVLRFAAATENLDAVEQYICENKLSKKEAEKLRNLALEEFHNKWDSKYNAIGAKFTQPAFKYF